MNGSWLVGGIGADAFPSADARFASTGSSDSRVFMEDPLDMVELELESFMAWPGDMGVPLLNFSSFSPKHSSSPAPCGNPGFAVPQPLFRADTMPYCLSAATHQSPSASASSAAHYARDPQILDPDLVATACRLHNYSPPPHLEVLGAPASSPYDFKCLPAGTAGVDAAASAWDMDCAAPVRPQDGLAFEAQAVLPAMSPPVHFPGEDLLDCLASPPFRNVKQEVMEEEENNKLSMPHGHVQQAWSVWQNSASAAFSLQERIMEALKLIARSRRDVLVQVWMPVMVDNQLRLTTEGQPYVLEQESEEETGLCEYRADSVKYQFVAEEGCPGSLGLPGRVFVRKTAEWSPDVRYYKKQEFMRGNDAEHCNVRGTLAVPVFELSTRKCVAVLELCMIGEKVQYNPEINVISRALQVRTFKHCLVGTSVSTRAQKWQISSGGQHPCKLQS